MNPMADAIRKKRMGSVNAEAPDGHMDGANEPGGGGKDLLGLVASLSSDERGKLKDILHAAGSNDQAIAKGGASSEEQKKIQDQINADDMREKLEDEPGQEAGDDDGGSITPDQSDDIGKSMLDSKYNNGPLESKPRNLSDRVKNHIASNLKSKGKL